MERITTSDVAHHPLLQIATANSASQRIKNHPFWNTLGVSKTKVSKAVFYAGSLAPFDLKRVSRRNEGFYGET
jgi:hypothetical protein